MRYSRRGAIAAMASISAFALHCRAGNTLLDIQVSTDGTNWSHSVAPSPVVLVRMLVSWMPAAGDPTPIGFANLTVQPVVRNPRFAFDTIMPFARSGNNTNGGAVLLDSTPMDGPFGRIIPFASTGPSTSDAYFVHQHSSTSGGAPDGNYYRIARSSITRWMGQGPTTGTAAVNNFNGAGGLACVQKSVGNVGSSDPAFKFGISNIEIFRFAIAIAPDPAGSTVDLHIEAPSAGLTRDTATGQRIGSWFLNNSDNFGNVKGTVQVIPAEIVGVPAPGAAGLMAAGGLFSSRRRRR